MVISGKITTFQCTENLKIRLSFKRRHLETQASIIRKPRYYPPPSNCNTNSKLLFCTLFSFFFFLLTFTYSSKNTLFISTYSNFRSIAYWIIVVFFYPSTLRSINQNYFYNIMVGDLTVAVLYEVKTGGRLLEQLLSNTNHIIFN